MSESPEATARPAPGTPAATAAVTRSSGRSARLVGTGILLSRIAGFLRDRALAHYLGNSIFASAFRAALRLPNILQNLLGEGTLSASFIPVYARLLERGDTRAAGRLAGAVFALLLALAGALAVIGVTLAPILVRIAFPGYDAEQVAITASAVRIMFPMTGVLVLSAWALGVLNSHRRFLVSYTAPVVWNVAIIAAALGWGGRLAGVDLVVALSWGALIGGVLQFLVQLPFVLRLERSLSINIDRSSTALGQVVRNAGPAVLGRGVVQLSVYIDLVLASFLFDGAVAALGFAQTIYVLPVSLFGMSIAAAELPELAREGERGAALLQARLGTGLARVAFFVVPSAVGFILLGDVIVGALYQSGAFVRADTLLVFAILAAYSIGLVASTSTRLYSSLLYALNDTRTPARLAAMRVTIAAAVGLGLMLLLERYAIDAATLELVPNADGTNLRPLGAMGLALASGIAAWIEWARLRAAVHARIGRPASLARDMGRLLIAAVLPAAALRVALAVLPAPGPITLALFVLPLYGLVFLALAWWLDAGPARTLLGAVLRRNGRNGQGY